MKKIENAPQRILYHLSKNPGVPYRPYELSKILDLPNGTVRTALHRLKKRGTISLWRSPRSINSLRGSYTFTPREDPKSNVLLDAIEPKLHGINYHIREPKNIDGWIYPPDRLKDILVSRLHNSTLKENKKCFSIYEKWMPNRTYKITIYKKAKSVMIWINCSDNPLTYDEFQTVQHSLTVIFNEIWDYSKIRIVQLGDNEDYELFEIPKNFNPVRIQAFDNQFLQIYRKYKQNAIRKEIHIYPDGGLDPKAFGDALIDIQEKGNLLSGISTNKELIFKVDNLTDTVNKLQKENNELRGTVSKLTDVLTQFFQFQTKQTEDRGSSQQPGGGDPGGYSPPPEDPEPDFTGYG